VERRDKLMKPQELEQAREVLEGVVTIRDVPDIEAVAPVSERCDFLVKAGIPIRTIFVANEIRVKVGNGLDHCTPVNANPYSTKGSNVARPLG